MFRPLIILKKYLFVKPKWRILLIYTKKIERHKLENLKKLLEDDLKDASDGEEKAFIRGKIEIINLLLK